MTNGVQANRWLLPEGIQEVLPDEAQRLEVLRRELLDLFALWGYELVIPPFIEFLDSLLIGTGHDLDLQTFKLTDQTSGRTLGVRADMTPQVARIDAHNLHREEPTRLCYLGTVLHALNDPLEKSRSPLQVGAELYGHAGIDSDLEVVQLMLETLAVTGIQNVHLDLGHVAIFRELAKAASLDGIQEATIFDILQRKAVAELNDLLAAYRLDEPLRSMLAELPRLNGTDAVLERARKVLSGAGPEVLAALDYLDELSQRLHARFPLLPIHFDLAELRGYHYQTGVVFAAFVPGYGREIARGGRYDEIGKVFGRARPATGFSADVKVLASLTRNIPDHRPARVFAPAENDPVLDEKIRDLRVSGRAVIQELPGQAGGAEQMNCGYRLERRSDGWVVVAL
ncbi:MAG: ATP phosphoribosyltransferase regulatory subunit [Methylococcaceae bacterium]|nr:ATP phosphoribosyltransferase regulatory subunit [Methylococcaceae bacterium]